MDQIVSRELALKVKEIGFNEPCTSYYYRDILKEGGETDRSFYGACLNVPTQTQLSKWLREKHKLYVHVDCNASGWLWEIEKTNGTSVCWCNHSGPNLSGQWDTFEEALEDGLINACKLVAKKGGK